MMIGELYSCVFSQKTQSRCLLRSWVLLVCFFFFFRTYTELFYIYWKNLLLLSSGHVWFQSRSQLSLDLLTRKVACLSQSLKKLK